MTGLRRTLPKLDALLWRVRVYLAGRKWYQSESLPPTIIFLIDANTHQGPILHRFGAMHIS